MSTASRVLRLISDQGLIIAAVLAVLGLAVGTGALWVFATPPTETVTEQTAVQTVSTDVRTSAIVTGNTSLYERGERLEGMPVYFQRATPMLTLTIVTNTPEGVETQVSQRLTLEQQATRDGQVFFSTNRTYLDQAAVSTGSTTAAADLNISEIRTDISRNRNEIGAVGSYQAVLQLSVEYSTDQYEGTFQTTTPIVFTSGAYWLDSSLSDSREHAMTRTRQVTRPRDVATFGGPAVLSLLLLGAAAAVVYLRRGIDVESLSVDYTHDEYDEWISEGEFPTGTDKRYIAISTLEDLVDIAIDSNKRVIFDPSLDVYAVVDGDLVYYFSRDPFNIDVWLDT